VRPDRPPELPPAASLGLLADCGAALKLR
jgi:hypothetical protein